MLKVSKGKSTFVSPVIKNENKDDGFMPVTEEEAKFIEKKYNEVKDSGFMSDEELFALLDEE